MSKHPVVRSEWQQEFNPPFQWNAFNARRAQALQGLCVDAAFYANYIVNVSLPQLYGQDAFHD